MILVLLSPSEVIAQLKLYANLAGQKTPTFVSVKNYCNNQGEISNYVVNVGASYANAKEADRKFLSDPSNIAGLEFGSVAQYAEQARIALLYAIENESNQSRAQQGTYTQVFPNVRVHNETGRVYVYGNRISKEVLVPVRYREVNSAPLTIAKNIIRKNLKTNTFRQFCVDKLVEIRMNGETLEFEL